MGKGIYQKCMGSLAFNTIASQIPAFLLSIKFCTLHCGMRVVGWLIIKTQGSWPTEDIIRSW